MRPNTVCHNPEAPSRNFSKSNSQSLKSKDTDSIDTSSFDLSMILSTPIFVDMSGNLYDKINMGSERPVNSRGNEQTDNLYESCEDFHKEPVKHVSSVSDSQPQAFSSVPSCEENIVHQQPVRRNVVNAVPELPCLSPVENEPPVLARIPELTKVSNATRTVCGKSASFEELMAQTVSGLEEMRSYAQKAKSETVEELNNREIIKQTVSKQTVEQPTASTTANSSVSSTSEPSSTLEKREKFLSTINWGSFRRLLFSREAIKLSFLTVVVCGLVIAGSIYKHNNSNSESGLPEAEVAVSQPAALTEQTSDNAEVVTLLPSPVSEQVANNASVPQNQNQMYPDSYQSPTLVSEQTGYDMNNPDSNSTFSAQQYAQQNPNTELGNGNILPPSNESTNLQDNNFATMPNKNQTYTDPNAGFDAMPQFNSNPEYAPVTPAVGSQYSPSDYESPVLEEEPVDYAGSGIPNNEMR